MSENNNESEKENVFSSQNISAIDEKNSANQEEQNNDNNSVSQEKQNDDNNKDFISNNNSETEKNNSNNQKISEKNITETGPTKLMVMLIPKVNKSLPLPLNALYFFIELFAYENNMKQLTDENNDLVFYLMDIDWLLEYKKYYNYKCIEFIIKQELIEDKTFITKLNSIINTNVPYKLDEDFKLINKFNNIIINPEKTEKKFGEYKRSWGGKGGGNDKIAPKKIKYDTIAVNKNIVSDKLDILEDFSYYPKCVLINERLRNILYLEYKDIKFYKFQKGEIAICGEFVFIRLTNKIVEVCSIEKINLLLTPLYILYYNDVSNVPFWQNVLYENTNFQEVYLLKRIHKDNKHIQFMLDPYNKEYIGYVINLNVKYGGEKIDDIFSSSDENYIVPDDAEIQQAVEIISKYNLDGLYKNEIMEEEKNSDDEKDNEFLLRMANIRKKKEEELYNRKKKLIDNINKKKKEEPKKEETPKKEKTVSSLEFNGEVIGFVQGGESEVEKNGDGYLKPIYGDDSLSNGASMNMFKNEDKDLKENMEKILEKNSEMNDETNDHNLYYANTQNNENLLYNENDDLNKTIDNKEKCKCFIF